MRYACGSRAAPGSPGRGGKLTIIRPSHEWGQRFWAGDIRQVKAGTPESVRRLALISAILASTIAAVDASAVNVALPAIGRDLGGGFAAQQWISNAYLLTLSALILLAGSLTDRLGERRVFTAGVAGFGIGSALCAAAPTVGVL